MDQKEWAVTVRMIVTLSLCVYVYVCVYVWGGCCVRVHVCVRACVCMCVRALCSTCTKETTSKKQDTRSSQHPNPRTPDTRTHTCKLCTQGFWVKTFLGPSDGQFDVLPFANEAEEDSRLNMLYCLFCQGRFCFCRTNDLDQANSLMAEIERAVGLRAGDVEIQR